jgi:hypothetical protein
MSSIVHENVVVAVVVGKCVARLTPSLEVCVKELDPRDGTSTLIY